MIQDILTVMGKEIKEILLVRGTMKGSSFRILVFLAVVGVFTPYQMGRGWVQSPFVLFYSLWFPFILVSTVVADVFAGERERHTLETLLASRLSDTAILVGKIATAVVYSWGMVLGMLLIGLVTVNAAQGQGKLLVYPAPVALGSVALSLLVSILAAALGVLVSLKAPTVRQAQQTLSIGAILILIVPMLGFQMLPAEMKNRLWTSLSQMDVMVAALAGIGIVAAIDLVLLTVTKSKFRRTRLILD